MKIKPDSKISIINGSPRGKGSNSKFLAEYFISGYEQVRREKIELQYLKNMSVNEQQQVFLNSDFLIVIFPLYTDAMPGMVKEFFENLSALRRQNTNLNLGFFVHSGFPEAHHSTYVARYLEKLSKRLGVNYMGTAIKGGTEGMKIMSDYFKRHIIRDFTLLGRKFALSGEFSEEILEKLKTPYHLSVKRIRVMKVMNVLGMNDWYWHSQLKKNKAFEQRFAQPYLT